MSLLYRVTTKRNPQNPEGQPKYYIVPMSRGSVSFDKLLERAAVGMTVIPGEIRLALDRALVELVQYVSEGFTVVVEGFGYFRLVTTSEGSDTEKEATPDKVSKKRMVFYPNKNVRRKMTDAPMQKLVLKELDGVQIEVQTASSDTEEEQGQ